jgi:hypothetical protein
MVHDQLRQPQLNMSKREDLHGDEAFHHEVTDLPDSDWNYI